MILADRQKNVNSSVEQKYSRALRNFVGNRHSSHTVDGIVELSAETFRMNLCENNFLMT